MLRAPLPVIDTSNGYTPADPILGPAIVEALFASVWSESPTTPSNVSIHIDPRVRAEWARDHTSTIGLAFSLNAKLGYSPSIRTDIYVGQDFAFLGPHLTYGWCAQIKGDSDPLFGGGGECGDGVIFGRTAYWSNFAGGEVYPYPDRAFDLWLNGNLPHEIAHNAQVQAARNFNNSDYWRTYPAWLREGWAEIVKVAVWGRSKGLTYREAREVYFGVIKQRCAPMAISDFHVPASTASRCEYDYGMLATEYLLASLRNIQAPFAMQQRSHAANFPDAFREAYAFDLAEFTAKADAYVAAQYAMHAPVTPR